MTHQFGVEDGQEFHFKQVNDGHVVGQDFLAPVRKRSNCLKIRLSTPPLEQLAELWVYVVTIILVPLRLEDGSVIVAIR